MPFNSLQIIIWISCGALADDLLAKFHQHDYKIKDCRQEMVWYDKSVYRFFEIHVFKFNRTTTATNVSFNYLIDLQDKQETLVQGYKFLSNEFRTFPVRFQVSLSKTYEANTMGFQSGVERCGFLNNTYFVKDTTYYLCNFLITEGQFPPLMPSGIYKFELTHLYKNRNISQLNAYGEVYRPIYPPKEKSSQNKKNN